MTPSRVQLRMSVAEALAIAAMIAGEGMAGSNAQPVADVPKRPTPKPKLEFANEPINTRRKKLARLRARKGAQLQSEMQ